MSDMYTRIYDKVTELREKDVEPDKIVIPSSNWEAVKSQAEVLEGEGYMGGDATFVNAVRCVHNSPMPNARIRIEVPEDE